MLTISPGLASVLCGLILGVSLTFTVFFMKSMTSDIQDMAEVETGSRTEGVLWATVWTLCKICAVVTLFWFI